MIKETTTTTQDVGAGFTGSGMHTTGLSHAPVGTTEVYREHIERTDSYSSSEGELDAYG